MKFPYDTRDEELSSGNEHLIHIRVVVAMDRGTAHDPAPVD